MDPKSAHPSAAIDEAKRENAPLLGLPSSVEPGRLSKHSKDAGPPAQPIRARLREPCCERAEHGNCNLVDSHSAILPY